MKSCFACRTGLFPLVLCLLSMQVRGETRPSERSPSQSQPAPNIAGHLEILGFTLGKSTLADVEAKLGKSAARRCSSGEEASKGLCYLVGDTTVVFESGFSGGWKVLDGYKVISDGSQRSCYRRCPRASQVTNEVRTEGGLELGLTREKLIALLGRPKESRGSKLTFEWESRQAMTKEQVKAESETFNSPITDPYYDVQDTIRVTLTESRVAEFSVNHVVSY
jgi:hypothetical protein